MSGIIKKLLITKLIPGKPVQLVQYKNVPTFHKLKAITIRFLSSTDFPKNVYLLDEDGNNLGEEQRNANKYTKRTHTCGELRSCNIGQRVTLCGWLEYQRMNRFLVLRDSYGEIQLIVRSEDKNTQKLLGDISYETILQVNGTVLSRPKNMINSKQETGEIEVAVDNFSIVNKANDNLPFNIREFQKAKEALRMQYRYLDIRFPFMQRNLRFRSKLLMRMREFLINNNFIDVETPTLFKATPGGAQEFIVPTRFPGKFYSLVQSPQQFKQMLMAGALDRYFQIARCYRDEGSRSDRQPEFTQLDIELSFTDVEGVIQLIEDLLVYTLEDFVDGIPCRFKRMSYASALETYGSDKPDTRFDFELRNCTEVLGRNHKLSSNISEDFGAYLVVFPKEYANLNKIVKEKLKKIASQHSNAKFIQVKVNVSQDWLHKIGRLLSEDIANVIMKQYNMEDGSVLFLTYGDKDDARSLLGKVRLEYANFLENLGVKIRKPGFHFLWILDFPLFERCKESGTLNSAHHPFTAPHPDDLSIMCTDPLKTRALAYDLVLNGNEVGGGSIRIHDPSLQEKVLKILNLKQESLQHIVDMLGSGCPPHGGIALGLDRLLSVLLNTTSIRDVIAFPKTFEGKDPVSQAPSDVSEEILKLYHIKTTNT